MISNGRIGFAIAGLGRIGKRHADILAAHPECSIVAGCDILPGHELGFPGNLPLFHSVDELLLSGVPFDVLSIATPNGLHEAHALKALDAGKHVVIEKPMALSSLGCQNIIARAKKQGLEVFCVMQNRFSPSSLWLKDLWNSGRLGKCYMIQVNCFWNRDERYYQKGSWRGSKDLDGGVLFTQFSHFIDMLVWLFGGINVIGAQLGNFSHPDLPGLDDSGQVSFMLPDGSIGGFNYTTSCWDENFESNISIIAEKGTLKIAGQYLDRIEYCHIQSYSMLRPQDFNTRYGVFNGPEGNHRLFYDSVVNRLKRQGPIMIDPADGAKTVTIIRQILEAGNMVSA